MKSLIQKVSVRSRWRTSTRIGIALFVVALLVRGFVCFRDLGSYGEDPDAYGAIAKTLATTGIYGLTAPTGETIPTAFRPPLYPYVLSLLLEGGEKLFPYGVAAFHTLLGCITVLCTYRASRRLLDESRNHHGSILAASLVIVDPILLQQSSLLMTETLAAALASIIVWWWVRHAEWSSGIGSAVALGVFLAMAFFCRPTFLVWAGMLCACVGLVKPYLPTDRIERLGRAAIVASIVMMAVGVWAMRNARAIGYPAWATTHGGYTLLLGNNPLFYDYLRSGEFGTTWNADPFLIAYSHRYDADPATDQFWRRQWDKPGVITVKVTEHDDDQRSYEAAKATIRRQPGMFVWACVVRTLRLWSPIPHRTGDRSWSVAIAVGAYYTLLYVAVIMGLWRLGRSFWRQKWWPIPALFLALTLVHTVYWSNIRMRTPAIPALAILAGAAISRHEDWDL